MTIKSQYSRRGMGNYEADTMLRERNEEIKTQRVTVWKASNVFIASLASV